MRVFLLSCGKTKGPAPARAIELYKGPLFRRMLRYARNRNPDAMFILSAKHGLLRPQEVIAPYERTLKTMSVGELNEWADRVVSQLRRQTDLDRDHFTVLASKKYRLHLLSHLRHHCVPMAGLRLGEQLRFLDREANP